MNKKKLILLFICMISLIIVLSGSVVLAKYIRTKTSNIGVTSDKFYFTLNLLGNTNTDETLEKEFHLYGGDSKNIVFYVQNYFDELRYTNSNIKYNVEVVDGSSYSTLSIGLNNVLNGGSCKSQQCTLNISEEYNDGDVVKVKVSSYEPYVKTMYVSFVLHSYSTSMGVSLNDSVGSLYLEVVVSANVIINANKLIIDYSDINVDTDNLQVDLTNNYLLDSNNELITNKLPDGESFLKQVTITKKINNGEAISLYFFKTNLSENYKNLTVSIQEVINGSDVVYTIKLSNEGGM